MGILRNREFVRWLLGGVCAGVAGVCVCAVFSPAAALTAAIAAAAQLALFAWFTARRYRDIAALSGTLRRVNAGDYSLDAGDGEEGELSILQSEIYKTTLMLRQQSERLLAEKEQLSRSLSDISHQLRTPLTSMFVLTELLCDGKLADEKRGEFTARLRAQLERLQWLVESLLKLSRLDAGAAEFTAADVEASALLQKALEPLRIPAELRGIALETQTDGRPVRCDPNWTAEALLNLLKNCVEHTPSGGRVRAEIRSNPIYTQMAVSDTGPGFNPDELPLLFTRFYRGKNPTGDGVGIGLAMARSIAAAQGGTLTAENARGGGALFTLRLPRVN